jgi:hypothetical protein
MADNQNLTLPDDGLMWRLWIFPDVGGETISVMKIHHCIADGLGMMLIITMLQDEYKPSMLIQTTKTLNWCWQLLLLLLKPVTLTYAFLFFLFWPTDKNCIKPQVVNLAGRKNNALSMPFSVPNLKKIAKPYNATLNDVVLALLSMSLQEYMRDKGDATTKSVNLLVPFSLRQLPKTEADHIVENDFSPLCFTMQLSDSFEKAVTQIKNQTNGMKYSLYPYGVNALTQFIGWFPGIVGQLVMMWVVSKATIVMSNVPGPKDGLNFPDKGMKCLGFFGLIPGLGDLAFGISATSMHERLYMAVQADTSYVEKPEEIRNILNKNYQQLVRELEAREK